MHALIHVTSNARCGWRLEGPPGGPEEGPHDHVDFPPSLMWRPRGHPMSPKEGPRDHVDYPRSLMWRPEGLRQVFLFGCWRGGLTTKKTLGRGGQGLVARLL